MSRQRRIIEGTDATIQEFPFIVALENKADENQIRTAFCAGSIYNSKYIITAAHCVHGKDKNSIEVRAGSALRLQGGDVYSVSEIIPHLGYNQTIEPYPNDIALLRLEVEIHLANDYPNKQFISLQNNQDWLIITGKKAVTAGWGITGCQITETNAIYVLEDQLKKAEVLRVNFEFCHNCWLNYFPAGVPENSICASMNPGGFATTRTCYGDSGGPLVLENKLIGIVAAGVHGNCPDLFTAVWPYKDWIEGFAGPQNNAIMQAP